VYGFLARSRAVLGRDPVFPPGKTGTQVDEAGAMAKRTNSATVTETPGQAREAPGSPDPQRISQRAYELYLQRGGSDGRDWEDWLEAERELSGNEQDRGDKRE
jgi:hypothetical protein